MAQQNALAFPVWRWCKIEESKSSWLHESRWAVRRLLHHVLGPFIVGPEHRKLIRDVTIWRNASAGHDSTELPYHTYSTDQGFTPAMAQALTQSLTAMDFPEASKVQETPFRTTVECLISLLSLHTIFTCDLAAYGASYLPPSLSGISMLAARSSHASQNDGRPWTCAQLCMIVRIFISSSSRLYAPHLRLA